MRRVVVVLIGLLFFWPVAQAQARSVSKVKIKRLKRLFKGRYSRTMILHAVRTGVPRVLTCSIMERRWLARDPVGSHCWLVGRMRHKVQSPDAGQVAKLLKRVRFKPRSAKQALAAAKLLLSCGRCEWTMTSVKHLNQKIPVKIRRRVTAPKVSRKGADYEVVLYTYARQTRSCRLSSPQLTEYRFTIGKGKYKVKRRSLWRKGRSRF